MVETCGGDLSTVMLENPAHLSTLRSCSSPTSTHDGKGPVAEWKGTDWLGEDQPVVL